MDFGVHFVIPSTTLHCLVTMASFLLLQWSRFCNLAVRLQSFLVSHCRSRRNWLPVNLVRQHFLTFPLLREPAALLDKYFDAFIIPKRPSSRAWQPGPRPPSHVVPFLPSRRCSVLQTSLPFLPLYCRSACLGCLSLHPAGTLQLRCCHLRVFVPPDTQLL